MDSDGSTLGIIRDLVSTPGSRGTAPRLKGFVATVDRRQIFVHLDRVDALDRDGVHLRGGTVDLRRFAQRSGEMLVTEDLLAKVSPQGAVRDVGFNERPDGSWWLTLLATSSGGRLLRRGNLSTITWDVMAPLLGERDPALANAQRLSELHKADAADELGALPAAQRNRLAETMDAESLADVLEELPEGQQVEIIEHLSTDDAVAVLDEMEIDDEIDLLKELQAADREELFDAMDDDDVSQLRRLISYRDDTAGGMMTPEAIVVTPDTSVAAAIAMLRDGDLPPALSVRLVVANSPTAPPTGNFHGIITLPRLLKEPPSHEVSSCLRDLPPTVAPNTPDIEVAQILARYDLMAVAVVDSNNRFLGAVTVDDVLLRVLPEEASP